MGVKGENAKEKTKAHAKNNSIGEIIPPRVDFIMLVTEKSQINIENLYENESTEEKDVGNPCHEPC